MTSDQFECLSCGGRYTAPQSDGTVYMHVCPPLTAAGKKRPEPRKDGRNENHPGDVKPARAIVSEGRGVKCISRPKLQEPAWITQYKKQLAEEAAKDDA